MDLTWWYSSRTQFTVGYTFQRLTNPGQVTSINPFVETFAAGVTAKNHLLWTAVAVTSNSRRGFEPPCSFDCVGQFGLQPTVLSHRGPAGVIL